MFGLFKKKATEPNIINKVWISKQQKWNSCLQLLKEKPATLFVAWFDETYNELNQFLERHHYSSKVIMYRQVNMADAMNYVFAEHYPLAQKEQELFAKLNIAEATILSGLDEPFFQLFGSDKIVELLSKLGMNEDEAIEHPMITASIINAQKKLAKQILIDYTARSQKDWMEKNVATN